jgi:hypothetical protein
VGTSPWVAPVASGAKLKAEPLRTVSTSQHVGADPVAPRASDETHALAPRLLAHTCTSYAAQSADENVIVGWNRRTVAAAQSAKLTPNGVRLSGRRGLGVVFGTRTDAPTTRAGSLSALGDTLRVQSPFAKPGVKSANEAKETAAVT